RSCGVRVLRFAVGFGKPLLSRFDRRGTEWCLCPIPLGGYVLMVMDPEEAKARGLPAHESLEGVSRPKRAWIIFAGPLANFLRTSCSRWC
ncbi:MAG: site-2 protease family protein, partial [Betaproteobacteria bacterium AqS2]|nr:site-2 protease family protein [Betaproteobacteria bacterium AqS2]